MVRNIAYLILLVSTLLSNSCSKPGKPGKTDPINKIHFRDISFSAALDSAASNNKLIFVDAFAEWCMPCRQMDKTVFTEKSIVNYFNAHFINLQIDIEKGEGPAFSHRYNVSLLPTLLFLDSKGKVIYTAQGFKSPSKLKDLAQKAIALYKGSNTGS